ncbi:hypothetical protein BZL29_3562 [Mycobacterium kansasii]|uniref:Uncharacterized protein n=1 Tax=Mycobacterium kansasii TaxID=1768 RepID=A0A1V3XDQ2_MYCKA|nr:hypothetical protein BZL29_3562 [Mycobacterium kansasii]
MLVFLAALLLGPGIPLALLYAGKWYAAKIPGEPMLAERIPVEVDPDSDTVVRNGSPFDMADTDLLRLVPGLAGGARKLSVLGVTLSATVGRSPFGTGHVIVDADGRVSVGSALPGTDRTGLKAVLPLAVHNKWVVLHDPGGPPNAAEVLLLVGGRTDTAVRQRLYDDVGRRLPELLTALRQRAADAGLVASTDGEPGSPSASTGRPRPHRTRSPRQNTPRGRAAMIPGLSTHSTKEPHATIPDCWLWRLGRRDVGLHDGPAALRTARGRYREPAARLAIRRHRCAQRG